MEGYPDPQGDTGFQYSDPAASQRQRTPVQSVTDVYGALVANNGQLDDYGYRSDPGVQEPDGRLELADQLR